jgi:ferrochelatase
VRDSYDALLLLSFGGPEGPEDVMPFLRNVTRGRGVPEDRLAEVAEHYLHFGGVSPINAQNRALLAAIRADFAAHGLDLPVYWGNRNWDPYLADTLRQMGKDGVRRALAFATSAYTSYSGCRQYQDDIAAARAEVGAGAPAVDKLRHFFNHPGFIEPTVDAVRSALDGLPAGARLVFTAHSIPVSMAANSGPDGDLYLAQLTEAARLVAAAAAPGAAFDLVWQSRSGPPQVPWLEPDINDHLERLPAAGVEAVVVVPIGFVSDHMEVVWDLDNEAAQTARRLGLGYARAATPGTDPRFVTMVRELVTERMTPGCPRLALGTMGPSYDLCPVGCCPAPVRPARL